MPHEFMDYYHMLFINLIQNKLDVFKAAIPMLIELGFPIDYIPMEDFISNETIEVRYPPHTFLGVVLYGNTLLGAAISGGVEREDFIRVLLDAGADVNKIDMTGKNALILVCENLLNTNDYIKESTFNEILNKTQNLNFIDNNGQTAFSTLAKQYIKDNLTETQRSELLLKITSLLDAGATPIYSFTPEEGKELGAYLKNFVELYQEQKDLYKEQLVSDMACFERG